MEMRITGIAMRRVHETASLVVRVKDQCMYASRHDRGSVSAL